MKLHLGSGKRFIPGFTHVDLADFPHIQCRRDVRNLDCFADNSAELIYACHVLEYFDRAEVVPVLMEWRRVLKYGGILRLSVPDWNALVRIYQASGDLRTIVGPLFGSSLCASWEAPGTSIEIHHQTVYDWHDLHNLLAQVGFGVIRRWDWRTTEHAAVDDYSQACWPHMDKERGIMLSLNVEAVK